MRRRLFTLVAAVIIASSSSLVIADEAQAEISPTTSACAQKKPTLRVGAARPDCTAALQGFLRHVQTPGLAIDGIFGKATEKSVVGYQTNQNLAPDGIVGAQTWNFILLHCGALAGFGDRICAAQFRY
jgi:peptidoglycan hydrolase-like protein with peptidoglycan-binding domain